MYTPMKREREGERKQENLFELDEYITSIIA